LNQKGRHVSAEFRKSYKHHWLDIYFHPISIYFVSETLLPIYEFMNIILPHKLIAILLAANF
jgi:hypothetical protein